MWRAITWTNGDLVLWCHVTSTGANELTHSGRVTHICVGKLTNIGSDNGLSPGRRQAIIWTNAGILLIGPLGTKFKEIFIEIHTFSFNKIHLKTLSEKWRPLCLSLNVLNMESMTISWNYVFTFIYSILPLPNVIDCTQRIL